MSRPRLQYVFLTGRSCWGNWALSPQQLAFMHAISDEGQHCVAHNFPWLPQPEAWRQTGIVRASLSNMLEYLASRHARFVRCYRETALEMLAGADQTIVLAGSCGLELFNNLQLPAEVMPHIAIFAYGPVARQRPTCRHVLVQGRTDYISRCWFPSPDKQIESGHMHYLTQPALPALCRAFVADIHGGSS
ncbi:hypothetical protein GA0061071_10536 [Kosakonia oryzendophytica]|uniref:Uracil DNA glycosylase superfamily protein n=1 Tax=Kosakonia oryzendophytica TaxID=1005665 RepID=A0A1C4BHH3_9ENTR|nr:hypothetical protein [Kosakonia oryzendophytica]SCC06305.1 hypothetical protein GA0061071_10536 [Kosakonia oryzendophytica]